MLGDADASLAYGSPFLTVAEPALLLLAFALSAFGGAIGDEDALDAFCFRGFLIFVGMKAASAASRCGVRPRRDLGLAPLPLIEHERLRRGELGIVRRAKLQ